MDLFTTIEAHHGAMRLPLYAVTVTSRGARRHARLF